MAVAPLEETPPHSVGGDPDTFLSFDKISAEDRNELYARHVTWFDVEIKERSNSANDLGEEEALFLRRYDIRFFRTKE